MSLRGRLTFVLALLSAIAASTTAGVAYAATSARMNAQVDQSLAQGAADLSSMGTMMGSPASTGNAMGSSMMAPATASGAGSASTMNGQDLGALGLVVVQYLDSSGAVTSTQGQVKLPVEPRDRDLARAGGKSWLHNATAGSASYRILTKALPGGGAVQLALDDSGDQRVLASLRWWFGLVDLTIVVLAAFAGWVFARQLTAPLRYLASAAERVASTGTLDIPVHPAADDETGRLARAFSSMLGALARSRDQQHRLAEDAAHELRTPLTSLRTNVDIMRRHDSLPYETRARILGALDTELRELTFLFDELVELSTDRLDEQVVEPVELDQLATAVVTRARQRSGRTIILESEPCVVDGQARSLSRALTNLVDNAIKFSGDPASASAGGGSSNGDGTTVGGDTRLEPGAIEVSVREGRVEVRDHGPGIDAEDLSRIFDRFYRSAAARSRAGSGLGLAIVNHVAVTHGGHAFAANHPGGGAVVGFEIPARSLNRAHDLLRRSSPTTPTARVVHPAVPPNGEDPASP